MKKISWKSFGITLGSVAFIVPMIVTTSIIAARLGNLDPHKNSISFNLPASITIDSVSTNFKFSIDKFYPGKTLHTVDEVQFFVVDDDYSLVTGFSFGGNGSKRTISYGTNFSSVSKYKLVSYIADTQNGSKTYSTSTINMVDKVKIRTLQIGNGTDSWHVGGPKNIFFVLTGTYGGSSTCDDELQYNFFDSDHTTNVNNLFYSSANHYDYIDYSMRGENPHPGADHTYYIDFISKSDSRIQTFILYINAY